LLPRNPYYIGTARYGASVYPGSKGSEKAAAPNLRPLNVIVGSGETSKQAI
jgi:hypothetical protein